MATSTDPPLRRKSTATDLFRITMNKFLKKKASEPLIFNDETANAFLSESAAPVPPPPQPLKKSASRWKRGKKPIDEKPLVALDLTLPSEDDFRTSLFMPALSARFSMLREQDDPNSLLGKASDDSVLQPRRRSRMDFGLPKGGLDDIAEVASMRSAHSSLRPTLIELRQDSFVSEDSYHSESESTRAGSVMGRSRPGEGNTMFGGRQKVYMIPRSTASSARGVSRTLYEDDVRTTSFHKQRQERSVVEEEQSIDAHGFDFGLDQSTMNEPGDQDDNDEVIATGSFKALSHSPSQSSSEHKWSTRSTHSEARSSTAATSVASQPVTSTTSPTKSAAPAPNVNVPAALSSQLPKRSDTKTRRLYEQGLDQHMQEQQTSALSRLNSIQKPRALGSKPPALYMHGTQSASNIHDQTRQPVFALPEESSPPMLPLRNLLANVGFLSEGSAASAPVSPLPQHGLGHEDANAFTQALEPADRGKATAMGAFNKPKQAFDEQQYLERQRQLQKSASTRKVSAPKFADRQPGEAKATIHTDARSPPKQNQKDHQPTNAYSVFQRAAQLNHSKPSSASTEKPELPDPHRTFFGNIGGSDSEDDDEARQPKLPTFKLPDSGNAFSLGKWQPTTLPAVMEHPAMRSQTSKSSLTSETKDIPVRPVQTRQPSSPTLAETPKVQTPSDQPASSTLRVEVPEVQLRRSRLVQHLRQGSNQSSTTQGTDRTSTIDMMDSPELSPQNLEVARVPGQSITKPNSRVGSFATSNPWDLDDIDDALQGADRASHTSISPIDNEPSIAPFDARLSTFKDRQSVVSEMELESHNSAQSESLAQHTRDASTGTQRDRDALDNELAARANAIKESMKSKVDSASSSRGASPARTASNGFKAFSMLRSKPSRESVETSHASEPLSQGLGRGPKLFNQNTSASRASSSTQNSQRVSAAHTVDSTRSRDNSVSTPPVPSIEYRNLPPSEPEAKQPVHQFGQPRENSGSEVALPIARSTPSVDSSRATSSATTSRSRSRTGPHLEDLEKPRSDQFVMSGIPSPDLFSGAFRNYTPQSTPEINQSSFESPRKGSGGRTAAMTNYFEAKSLHPIATGSKERLSPAPSPALTQNPYSPLLSPSPLSPAGSFAHNMTPPLSGASTPLQSSFTPPPSIPFASNSRIGITRRKTVSKVDISEPTLISSTSNIDLVSLPEGASLRNGMEEAPPVPPLNPARRATKKILGLGRKDSSDSTQSYRSHSKTRDAHSRRTPEAEQPFSFPSNRSRSETLSPQKSSSDRSDGAMPNGFPRSAGSPEHTESPPAPPLPASIVFDGAMF